MARICALHRASLFCGTLPTLLFTCALALLLGSPWASHAATDGQFRVEFTVSQAWQYCSSSYLAPSPAASSQPSSADAGSAALPPCSGGAALDGAGNIVLVFGNGGSAAVPYQGQPGVEEQPGQVQTQHQVKFDAAGTPYHFWTTLLNVTYDCPTLDCRYVAYYGNGQRLDSLVFPTTGYSCRPGIGCGGVGGYTLVDLSQGGSPTLGSPPILQLPIGGLQTYALPVAALSRYTCGLPSQAFGLTDGLPQGPGPSQPQTRRRMLWSRSSSGLAGNRPRPQDQALDVGGGASVAVHSAGRPHGRPGGNRRRLRAATSPGAQGAVAPTAPGCDGGMCQPFAPNGVPPAPFVVNFDAVAVGAGHQMGAEGSVPYPGQVLSVSSDCLLQWDTTHGTQGDLYALQVVVKSDAGVYTHADFLIQLTAAAPACKVNGPSTFLVLPGSTLTTTVTATPANSGAESGAGSGAASGFDTGFGGGMDIGFGSGVDSGTGSGTGTGFDIGFGIGVGGGAESGAGSGADGGAGSGALIIFDSLLGAPPGLTTSVAVGALAQGALSVRIQWTAGQEHAGANYAVTLVFRDSSEQQCAASFVVSVLPPFPPPTPPSPPDAVPQNQALNPDASSPNSRRALAASRVVQVASLLASSTVSASATVATATTAAAVAAANTVDAATADATAATAAATATTTTTAAAAAAATAAATTVAATAVAAANTADAAPADATDAAAAAAAAATVAATALFPWRNCNRHFPAWGTLELQGASARASKPGYTTWHFQLTPLPTASFPLTSLDFAIKPGAWQSISSSVRFDSTNLTPSFSSHGDLLLRLSGFPPLLRTAGAVRFSMDVPAPFSPSTFFLQQPLHGSRLSGPAGTGTAAGGYLWAAGDPYGMLCPVGSFSAAAAAAQ